MGDVLRWQRWRSKDLYDHIGFVDLASIAWLNVAHSVIWLQGSLRPVSWFGFHSHYFGWGRFLVWFPITYWSPVTYWLPAAYWPPMAFWSPMTYWLSLSPLRDSVIWLHLAWLTARPTCWALPCPPVSLWSVPWFGCALTRLTPAFLTHKSLPEAVL